MGDAGHDEKGGIKGRQARGEAYFYPRFPIVRTIIGAGRRSRIARFITGGMERPSKSSCQTKSLANEVLAPPAGGRA